VLPLKSGFSNRSAKYLMTPRNQSPSRSATVAA
jgi:hypothetical protein